jgi:hypothetical protein
MRRWHQFGHRRTRGSPDRVEKRAGGISEWDVRLRHISRKRPPLHLELCRRIHHVIVCPLRLPGRSEDPTPYPLRQSTKLTRNN